MQKIIEEKQQAKKLANFKEEENKKEIKRLATELEEQKAELFEEIMEKKKLFDEIEKLKKEIATLKTAQKPQTLCVQF